jgi:hypothetical protein
MITSTSSHEHRGALHTAAAVAQPCRAAVLLIAVAAAWLAAPTAFAQINWDNLDGRLGVLAPENLEAERPAPPVDLTGTWMHRGQWRFLVGAEGKLQPRARALFDRSRELEAQGVAFNNVPGQCWPIGQPLVMTRVWPVHMIQLPTAVLMVSNFDNRVRWIYLDGREHTDPDIFAPAYHGESIGTWEGDALVVHTKNFGARNHFLNDSIPLSADFEMIERISLSEDGESMQIEYTLTDPQNWEGDWVETKTFIREHRVDHLESPCVPDLNEGLPGTQGEYVEFDLD